jgi:MFS family permease
VIGAAWLGAAALESGVSPVVGRVSDRRGRLFPCLIGLSLGTALMALFTLPTQQWQLIVLVMLAAPSIGMLWAPSMALLSDGAEALGIAQGFAFALSNLGWSIGQTAGSAASARLADATSDAVPYLLLSAVCVITLAVLLRARRTTTPLS